MTSYETLFIVHPNLTEEEAKAMTERVQAVIETAGTVQEVEEWGKKHLAYEIQKVREGYYTLITFEAEPSVLEELNHVFKITEDILRGIIIKKEW
jgi:small subunit ribosomal protein S6